MKQHALIFSLLFILGAIQPVIAQQSKVLVDNDKLKVTEYTSQPGQDVCGQGTHTHGDHVTILISDADVKTTNADGGTEYEKYSAAKHLYSITKNGKTEQIPTEGTFWAKGTTHHVTNVSNKPLKFYIVEAKH